MRYTNDLPAELKKILVDALTRINQTRDQSIRELAENDVDVETWVQTWGSTALGFNGMGGQAITGAYTTIVWAPNRAFGLVYFSTRFAYRVQHPFSDFFCERYAARNLPAVRDAYRLIDKVDGEKFTPRPDYGDLMTLAEFEKTVTSGGFIDYDGSGYYAKPDGYFPNLPARPSDIKMGKVDRKFTHVMWFNK